MNIINSSLSDTYDVLITFLGAQTEQLDKAETVSVLIEYILQWGKLVRYK